MASPIRQAATLAVRGGRLCLVTSRSGRRWVVPKGHVERGQTASQAAEIEAWEEAGVRGRIGLEPVGSFAYRKLGREYRALLFVLDVTEEYEDWPERAERRREWVAAAEAMARLEEPELRELVERWAPEGDISFSPLSDSESGAGGVR